MSAPADGPAALPAAARARVVDLAAARLGELPAEDVPAALRAVARFTPTRRARLGAAVIAATLETDADFRTAVADGLRAASPALAEALTEGVVPAAAPPEEVVAAAYLLRPDGWQAVVAQAVEELRARAAGTEARRAEQAAARLQAQLADAEAGHRRELAALRADLEQARQELRRLRGQLGEARTLAAAAERRAETAEAAAEAVRHDLVTAQRDADTRLRRARARLAAAEAAAEASRRAVREDRAEGEQRLWLLVETLSRTVSGLRDELALRPAQGRPADRVAEEATAGEPFAATPRGSLGAEDPAVLDDLLALPLAHLIVDGYNVTKTGYPALTLEAQRSRLLAGLGVLGAQTGAEITCVFDGAARPLPTAAPAPRGVRLLFSGPDEIADDTIRRLVAAEPAGRPVIVVSSDREVAEDARRAGAWHVASLALVRRLDRG